MVGSLFNKNDCIHQSSSVNLENLIKLAAYYVFAIGVGQIIGPWTIHSIVTRLACPAKHDLIFKYV